MSVHVSGLGAVTPVGTDFTSTWDALLHGSVGIGRITRFDPSDHTVQIAGEIPDFDPSGVLSKPDCRRLETYAQYGIAAAVEALDQAGISPGEVDPERFSFVIGTGYGCTATNTDAVRLFDASGPARFGPLHAVYGAQDVVASYLSLRYQAWGEATSISTACASGNAALGQGLRLIALGEADVVVVVGAEGAVEPRDLAVVGGSRALTSTFNDDPTRASRPFDRNRDGFVLSAGGAAVVLESEQHLKRRGGTSYATMLGYGAATDAHHLTAPHPQGRGAKAAIRKALRSAGVTPDQVGYVNAHGTSTPLNDAVEADAITEVFAHPVPVSSTKSMTGHMIGAAGVVEAAVAVMSLHTGWVPPTVNCDDPEFEQLNVVHTAGREHPRVAISNSFGFGGHCTTTVFGATETAAA